MMGVDQRRSGGEFSFPYILEYIIINNYVLDSNVRPSLRIVFFLSPMNISVIAGQRQKYSIATLAKKTTLTKEDFKQYIFHKVTKNHHSNKVLVSSTGTFLIHEI